MPTQVKVAEKPILMSGPMVRAILEGRKTQTRRVIKPQPQDYDFGVGGIKPAFVEPQSFYKAVGVDAFNNGGAGLVRCPYGSRGSRLWVREGFKVSPEPHEPDGHYWLTYPADGTREEVDYSEMEMGRLKPGKSYPSIYLPRWASRITLEITGIRVERLQDIRTRDIEAEGILPDERYLGSANRYRHAFEDGWDMINGKRPGCSWADNPWVWCVSFRMIQPTGEQGDSSDTQAQAGVSP
jgi:hypothetical protein